MNTLQDMIIINESRRQTLLAEANQKRLAKIAQSDMVKPNYILKFMLALKHHIQWGVSSQRQDSLTNEVVQPATNR